MSVYISNSFSLQMQGEFISQARPITVDEACGLVLDIQRNKGVGNDEGEHTGPSKSFLIATSCVGHADVAAVLSGLIGITVPVNRISVSLQPGDILVVGQYIGPRLPEGCSALPEGARIEWYVVTMHDKAREDDSRALFVALSAAADKARAQKCALVGVDQSQIEGFLKAENLEYQGFPDEGGRAALAKRLGLSAELLGVLLA